MDNEISNIGGNNLVQIYEDNRENEIFTDHKELIDSMPSVDTKYIEKIEEFEKAVEERDQFIGQLQDCIYRKDQVQNETEIKCVEFAKEIDSLKQEIYSLKHKLEESITLLQNKTTVSVVEHLELKDKLIEIQQNRLQEREEFDSLLHELKINRENLSELETKYKLITKLHKESNERHLAELEDRENLLEKNHKDELNLLRAQCLQELEEREAQEQTRKQKSLEEFNQCKEEVNDVKKQNNLLLEELKIQKAGSDVRMKELLLQIEQLQKEKDEKVLENVKIMEHLEKELREKYGKEIENLKNSNKAEVAAITEQIDFIEKKQIEEQKKIMGNLKEMHNEGQRYKRELETERGMKTDLLSEVEEARLMITNLESKNSLLEMELKAEKETSESRLQSLNELANVQRDLENQVTQLDENIKELNEIERRSNAEHELLAKAVEVEKEEKNKANLRIQELSSECEDLLRELETSKLQYSVIVEKNETLHSEVKNLQSKLKVVENEKSCLGHKMSELEHQIKNKQDLEKEKQDLEKEKQDLRKEKQDLEKEKQDLGNEKQDLEKEKQELEKEKQDLGKEKQDLKNEKQDLGKEKQDLEKDKQGLEKDKQGLENEIIVLNRKLSDIEYEKENLHHTITNLNDRINENSDLEAKVNFLSQEIQSCEKYKYECHALNEKIYNLCETLDEKCDLSSDRDVLRDCTATSDYCDAFSLLQSKLSFISDRLNETNTEINTVVQLKDLYKEELDKLNLKFKKKTEFETDLSAMKTKNTTENDQTSETGDNVMTRHCSSCKTVIATRDQGFQTSPVHSAIGLLTTQTIEEDYTIEEILIVPKTISLKGSVSLKNLKEIGAPENNTDPTLSSGLVSMDYEQLRSKYHDLRFVIKSLEYENSRLRRALLFKKSVKGHGLTSADDMEPKSETCDDESCLVDEQIKLTENSDLKVASNSKSIDEEDETSPNSFVPESEIKFPESLKEREEEPAPSTNTFTECSVGKLQSKDSVQDHFEEVANQQIKNDKQNVLTVKLQCQTKLNKALMEELKTKFSSSADCNDEWQNHLRRAVELFIETQHPYYARREELLTSYTEGWEEIAKITEDSVEENKAEGRLELEEKEKDDREEPIDSKLSPVLDKLQKLIDEQRAVQTTLKDVENRIIIQMEKNILHLTQEIGKENSLEVALRGIDSSLFKSGSTLVDDELEKNDILKEFQDITSSMLDRTQEEKMKLLQNQRNVLRILEENQTRISDILKKHLQNLQDASLGADEQELLVALAKELDASLNEEVISVEKMFGEILKQHSHEQALHAQSHSFTITELKARINSFLQQRYRNSSFSNSDVWKRLLAVLSQITVNLLHYYTVSQRFANDEGDMPLGPSIPAAAGACSGRIYQSIDESEDENSLKLEFDDRCPADEGSMNILDTTGVSEGMLEDLERSEQVKEVLAGMYPNLAKTLKGNYEQILIENLEKEMQEFIISLQASTGMLRILMLSKADEESSASSSKAIVSESGIAGSSLEPSSMNTSRMKPETREECISSVQIDAEFLSKEFSGISSLDFTTLKPSVQMDVEELVAELKTQLSKAKTEREEIQKQLHQTQGLYAGLLDDNKSLHNDFKKKEQTINELVKELTETKERLKKAEEKSESEPPTKMNRKHNERNIKERVKAVLAAKDKECFDQKELANRVRDLEVILEETVTERDKSLEGLNSKVSDLTQQLEVADRQLRSSRQFLEEQAAERDQEVEDLVKTNEKLKSQLKERETLVIQHASLQKEVQLLEKQLKEHISSLEEERARTDEKQRDLSAALEKVNDLREVIHSLETQLVGKNSEQQCLLSHLDGLKEELKESKQQNICLQNELDTLNQNNFASKLILKNPNELLYEGQGGLGPSLAPPRLPLERQVSISEEIENSKRDLQCQMSEDGHYLSAVPLDQSTQDCNLSQDCSLIENLITRFEKSTRGLEVLQFASITGTVLSDEELSVREQLEMNDSPSLEKTRSLSPGSLEAKLEEKFLAFERTAEAASKFIKDLEMRLSNLKAEYDDVVNEREYLHQRLSELAPIKSKLQKASRESELLRNDFENNLRVLNNDLTRSKKRETELQLKIEELESQFIAKEEELKSAINREKSLDKKNKGMEKTVREYSEEKESCRRQISEHLIRISSLEARIDEYRRSDSPHEYELKARINSLKNELENCRIELTMKYREIEELRYSVKELKDQLIVREEELDRLSQPLEPASLPQSTLEHRRQLMQALEADNRNQKMINQQLQEKLQNAVHKSESEVVLSNNLLSSLLDEKNSKIRELMTQRKRFVDSVQEVLSALENKHPVYEVAKTLKDSLNLYMGWSSHIERAVCPELQRRAPLYSTSDDIEIREVNMVAVDEYENGGPNSGPYRSNADMRTTITTDSSNLNLEPLMTPENKIHNLSLNGSRKERKSCSGDFAASSFDAREYNDYEVIVSENLALKDQSSLLEQEVRNLLEYQKKLEADFETAQEMLETKEEELQALASEADDCVTVPLQNSSQLNEMLFENDSLRQRIQELELKIESDAFNLVSVSEVDKLAEELESVRKALGESTKRKEDLTKEKDTLTQKYSYLETRVEEESLRCENLKQSLERQNEENQELSLQINHILTKHKDATMRHEKKIKALERDHFKELQDMKDKNIEREKQLCNEYEERLSGQVSDLAVKLSREKDESLKEIKTHYEELLSKAVKENNREVVLGENASSAGVNGASEDLQSKLQRELDISASLDQSLVSYFEGGSVGSRESSVVSEGGTAQEEWNSSNLRVQSLMRKVYKEGIKVLAQSELLFLEENQCLIKDVPETFQESTSSQDEIKLLKKKVEIMKHRLKLEESLKEELQKEYNRKREEVEELREQLAKESLKHLNLAASSCSFTCKEIVKETQEIVKLKEIGRSNEKQIQDLEEALKAERDNFSHVSNTLSHQRKQSSMTNEYQIRVIKELKDLLDKEKARESALMAENQELRLLNCQSMPLDESFSLNASLLDKEREIGELQLAVRNLTDEREIDRDRYIKDLQMQRIQIEQLENSLRLAESKKKALMAELNSKDLLLKDLQANIKVYEKETFNFKDDIEDRISRRVEALSLINLNTMKQKDLEIEALTQRLCQVKTELERVRIREKALKNETQKNVNLEFPRMKNVREYIETVQRQNQELHESLIRCTDEKQLLRQKVARLEGVIGEQNLQAVIQEKVLVRRNINEKNIHFAEKAALSTETSALKLALRQTEIKSENLEKELKALQLHMETLAMDVGSKREEFTIKYLYWKFNRSESHRRALIWQKEYLLHRLRQNKRTGERALLRYAGLVSDASNNNYERYQHVKLQGKARFKSVALIIVAIQRMKTIARRWQLGRKLEVYLKLPLSLPESQLPKISSCPIQPSSGLDELLSRNVKSPPRLEANPINNALLYQITGLTPPSKDVASTWKPGPALSRNLFEGDTEDNKDLNECVERLRSIHSLLGLPKSNS